MVAAYPVVPWGRCLGLAQRGNLQASTARVAVSLSGLSYALELEREDRSTRVDDGDETLVELRWLGSVSACGEARPGMPRPTSRLLGPCYFI